MAENPLRELNKLGQSVWQDYIRRGELLSGAFKRLIDEDGISGVTSNPSIFEKAIAGSKDYDDGIRKYVGEGIRRGAQLFERLAVEDIQKACDLLRPTYDATRGPRRLCEHRSFAQAGARHARVDRRSAPALEFRQPAESADQDSRAPRKACRPSSRPSPKASTSTSLCCSRWRRYVEVAGLYCRAREARPGRASRLTGWLPWPASL